MDQDKKCFSSLEESKNLITLENDSFIDSFKNEQLVLFNEEDDMIAFTFLITDDKVEGNGRVLLHIRPASHASSDVRSLAALSSLPITLGVPNSILARTSIHVPSLSHPTHTFSPSSPSDSDPSLQKSVNTQTPAELQALFAGRPLTLTPTSAFTYASHTQNQEVAGSNPLADNFSFTEETDSIFTNSQQDSESDGWYFQRNSMIENDPVFATSPSSDVNEFPTNLSGVKKWRNLFMEDEGPNNRSTVPPLEASLDEYYSGMSSIIG